MINDQSLIDTAVQHIPLKGDAFGLSAYLWLTSYLCGPTESYERACAQLEQHGWLNLDAAQDFGGFAYPKKEVLNDPLEVRAVLCAMQKICDGVGLQICAIEADTDFSPERSSFQTLYQIS